MKNLSSKPSTRAARPRKRIEGLKEKTIIKARDKAFFQPLDTQEKDLRDAVEKDALLPVSDQEAWREKLVQAARTTIAKNRHMSIRLSEMEIMLIRARAIELGMPYQTLIGSILHQYAEGKVKTPF